MKLSHQKVIFYSITGVVGLLLLSLVLTYLLPFHDPISITFKRIYPGAIIGSKLLSVNDIDQAASVGENFGINKKQAIDKFYIEQKAEALVSKLNVRISNDATTDEFRFLTKGNESDYRNLLASNYGDSERIFNKHAVRPAVVDAHLRMKYYSSIVDTSPAYKEAQVLLERYSKGEKFEDLAKLESDDKISGQLGGDLGFYESGQLLPELEDQVSISALGEIRRDIIITRLGYHLVYPVEYSNVDGKKKWHVKHILLVPEGYDAWISTQLNNIKITKLLKD